MRWWRWSTHHHRRWTKWRRSGQSRVMHARVVKSGVVHRMGVRKGTGAGRRRGNARNGGHLHRHFRRNRLTGMKEGMTEDGRVVHAGGASL